MSENENGNGRNGAFRNLLLYLTCALSLTGIVGAVSMYRELGIIKTAHEQRVETRIENERRLLEMKAEIAAIRALTEEINAIRHQRTIIVQQMIEEIRDNKRRLDALERRR